MHRRKYILFLMFKKLSGESILGTKGHQVWWLCQGFVQRRTLSSVRDRLHPFADLGHLEENDLWNNECEIHNDKLSSTCLHPHNFILRETKQLVMWGMKGTEDTSFTIPKSFRVFAYDCGRQQPKCESWMSTTPPKTEVSWYNDT